MTTPNAEEPPADLEAAYRKKSQEIEAQLRALESAPLPYWIKGGDRHE